MALPAASSYEVLKPSRQVHGRLLSTKLVAPRLRAATLVRAELLDLITRADAPLTLICAPAGYGKSTLAAHWIAQSGLPSAWVSLDTWDNNSRSFFSLLVAAIETIDETSLAGTRLLLDGMLEPSPQAIADAVMEDLELTTRPFALVLDDFHAIDDPAVLDAVGSLLAHHPQTLRLVIVSRRESALPLSRLRGRQMVFDLSQNDLRFSDTEAMELFQRANGVNLSADDVGQLNLRAEGWATGLQLVGHLLRGQDTVRVSQFTQAFSGNVRPIDSYLWEEVVEQQSPEIREFLYRISILDQLSADLCDAVTGRGDSAGLLRHLERERLFVVALDDVGRWYRFHHLFVDVLRSRLKQQFSEDQVAQLHQRAAGWLEAAGFISDAARQAMAGQDRERAGRLLEQVAEALYRTDRNQAQVELLHDLPDDVLIRNPMLAFYLAFALIRAGRMPDALAPLGIAEEAWLRDGDPFRLGLINLMYAVRSMAGQDAQRTVDFAQIALSLIPKDHPDEVAMAQGLVGIGHCLTGNCRLAITAFAAARSLIDAGAMSWMHFVEMGFSSAILMQQGNLKEAALLLDRIRSLTDHTHSLPYQQSRLRTGEILTEWNQIGEADDVLTAVDALCEKSNTLTWRGWICLARARAKWAGGEHDSAFDELDRAIAIGSRIPWVKVVRDARATQARFWLASGQDALARRWAESCDLDPLAPPTYERQFEYLTYVRLLIAEDRGDLALQILTPIGLHASAMGRDGDLVEIELLSALAHKACGDQNAALASLDTALRLGEIGGYLRTFANEGESIAPLLRHAAVRGHRRDYARRILHVIEGTGRQEAPFQTVHSDALSERELDVLRLVSDGLPNRSIGERLFISEKTVKKHLSNILAKLGAANRTQAVDQARRMGLI